MPALVQAPTAGTATFELEHDIPGLKAGVHPWPEARPACDAVVARVDQDQLISDFANRPRK